MWYSSSLDVINILLRQKKTIHEMLPLPLDLNAKLTISPAFSSLKTLKDKIQICSRLVI